MHYKNGRLAKQGDQVVNLATGQGGVLFALRPGNSSCNARLVPITEGTEYVTVGECVHLDDITQADLPDASKRKPD